MNPGVEKGAGDPVASGGFPIIFGDGSEWTGAFFLAGVFSLDPTDVI
jgi:hypothetical protein